MTTTKNPSLESERSFEELLARAGRRPAPEAEETRRARAAVKAEWRTAIRTRRRRRFASAAAAGIVMSVAVILSFTLAPDSGSIAVASITANKGTIYMLGEESQLEAIADPGTVFAGQTIETQSGATLGMTWDAGGSLRIDEQTRILFASTGVVELRKGRVYFDSDGAMDSRLIVRTEHGDVSHVGTQYMVDVDTATLAVSVREGSVSVEGRFHDGVAKAGQRLTLRDTRAPNIDPVRSWGEEWRWVEATASHHGFDGRPVVELIDWAARETGLSIEFSDTSTEHAVRKTALSGDFDSAPRVALRQALLAMDLVLSIDGGVIYISDPETHND